MIPYNTLFLNSITYIFLLPRSLSLVNKISFLACDVAVQITELSNF